VATVAVPGRAKPEGNPVEVLGASLRLGLTSFGGPVAHVGYFHRAYVVRRRWLDDATFADLVALCQSIPGPASSELGIAIGMLRAGRLGALAAWVGFTLPSAVALIAFALATGGADVSGAGWVHGLKLAAVAVVAQAVWAMGRRLAPDAPRLAIAALAAATILLVPSPGVQVLVIVAGGLFGWVFLHGEVEQGSGLPPLPISRRAGVAAFAAFAGMLAGIPALRLLTDGQPLALFDAFYRTGSLVFGGGHVVLPLLHEAVVGPGWMPDDRFLAGYAAAQAVPGPLFAFAGYLGAAMLPAPNGVLGAAIALIAIFLPGFLLVMAALPFWDRLRREPGFAGVLRGTNAAVVGILAAALYTPVWTSAIRDPADVLLAGCGLGMLGIADAPPWLVVVLLAGAGVVLRGL
jgi:chromate transporter